MNERCKHNHAAATCCECLTEMFATWEAEKRERTLIRQGVISGIRTYHSDTLGRVTIPED